MGRACHPVDVWGLGETYLLLTRRGLLVTVRLGRTLSGPEEAWEHSPSLR